MQTVHITSGDHAGKRIAATGIPGQVFVWHDILYDGPRRPGWPDGEALPDRARFLEDATGGGLKQDHILTVLQDQYRRLEEARGAEGIVLWFDACLFDQSMLAHILTCLRRIGREDAGLLCIDAFPGVEPYDGIGQLRPDQLASRYGDLRPVTGAQFAHAIRADEAFATRDPDLLAALSSEPEAPLPWIPAAAGRLLEELPDDNGLGRLERTALDAVRSGNENPAEILLAALAEEARPRYWGDETLWTKINGLAARTPPLVCIEGPTDRLPQWEGGPPLDAFRITPA